MNGAQHNPHKPTGTWSELLATRRRFGTCALITDFTDRILRRLGVRKIERVFLLTDVQYAGDLTANLLTPDQISAFRTAGQISCSDQAIAEVAQGKKICVGVIEDQVLCGFTWYALQVYRHSDSDFAFFDTRYICGFGAYIHPDYRGRQLRSAIVARALAYAHDNNKQGIVAAIDWTNFGSLRSARKIGYRARGWSYMCQWVSIGIDKSRYHLRQQVAQSQSTSVFIGNALTPVSDAAYRETLLCLMLDSAGPAQQPGWRERLKYRLRLSESKADWARRRGIPYLRFNRQQEAQVAELIASLDVDLLISYGAPILGKDMLQAPKMAAINVHPSLLPDYRGGSPMLWQMLREEALTGATVHLLSEGIDQGDILEQVQSALPRGLHRDQAFNLARQNSAQALSLWLKKFGVSGTINAIPQPRQSTTPFARNMTLASLNEQIDWTEVEPGMLFALARYLGRWPAELMPPPGLWQWLPWRACRFVLQPHAKLAEQWGLDTSGLRFSNHRGHIWLRPSWHPLRWLTHLRHWRRLRYDKGRSVYL